MPFCVAKHRLMTPAQHVPQAGPAAVPQPPATKFPPQCRLIKHGLYKHTAEPISGENKTTAPCGRGLCR